MNLILEEKIKQIKNIFKISKLFLIDKSIIFQLNGEEAQFRNFYIGRLVQKLFPELKFNFVYMDKYKQFNKAFLKLEDDGFNSFDNTFLIGKILNSFKNEGFVLTHTFKNGINEKDEIIFFGRIFNKDDTELEILNKYDRIFLNYDITFYLYHNNFEKDDNIAFGIRPLSSLIKELIKMNNFSDFFIESFISKMVENNFRWDFNK